MLIGIINFIPPNIANGVGHYTAFCKRVTGSWEQHDDIQTKIERIPINALSSMLVRPVIIAYVASN